MKSCLLGQSDLRVTEICLGTMTWGTQNTQAEAFEQMDYALERGVTFWDTAELYPTNPATAETYGNTERIIGAYFMERKNRDKVVLASKVAGPGRYIRGGAGFSRTGIERAIDDSLQRLNTDVIDLYQLHWPNRGSQAFSQQWNYAAPGSSLTQQTTTDVQDDMHETLSALGHAVKAGKIRYVGLSNETCWGTMEYLRMAREHGLPRVQSIQNEYSLLDRLFEPGLAEISIREKVELLAWSPLAGGLLSGKYYAGARPVNGRICLPGYNGQSRLTPQMEKAKDAYTDLARAHGLDPSQMALAFVLSRPFVGSCIIGATTMEQLKTDIDAAEVVLSREVLDGIEKIRRDWPMPY